ncbi:MAG: 4-(cytidine 5'-diphospho)-2-C-methyl-D-erythritol kinase [Phycisphaerales bacterium]|nr:MAG: 4-(cytidine 5'-diphospho)-2-C-methyl-D-erythritol kinase [Phycisphaerales bacterium]
MNSTALSTTMAASSVTATAPAKINLTLDVLGRRDDGYHDVRSLVIGVSLYDHIRCRIRHEPGIELICSDPGLRGSANLAHRATAKLAQQLGHEPALKIELEKRIPVGGGMGGGSSDAASTLSLCNDIWGAGLDPAGLAAIGAELGSDVPLFFSLPSAVVTGRGEKVQPVALRWSGWVLLVFVDAVVSTTEVYRAWRPSDAARLPDKADEAIVMAATADEVSALRSNHLEPAVLRVSPAVARIYDELNRAGLGPICITGAGSTLYRLFDQEQAAHRVQRRVSDLRIGVTTSVVAAPVGPASIASEES